MPVEQSSEPNGLTSVGLQRIQALRKEIDALRQANQTLELENEVLWKENMELRTRAERSGEGPAAPQAEPEGAAGGYEGRMRELEGRLETLEALFSAAHPTRFPEIYDPPEKKASEPPPEEPKMEEPKAEELAPYPLPEETPSQGGKRLLAEEPKEKKDHPVLSRLVNAASYLLLVALLAVVVSIRIAGDGAPVNIVGFSGMLVLSESMQDTIPKDSLVITHRVDPQSLEVGDNITYMVGDNISVTHQIIGILEDTGGDTGRRFETKGTANSEPDRNPVLEGNVVGKVIFHNLALGRAAKTIQANWPLIAFLVTVATVLSWVMRWIFREEQPRKDGKEQEET